MAAYIVPVPGIVLDRLRSLGLDAAAVLRHAGIAPSRFHPARAKLTVQEFFAFWRAIEAVDGKRDVGLRIGTNVSPHQLDINSMAAVHAPNLGEALQKFARYKRVVCGESVSVETTEHEARIRFHWLHIEDAPPLSLVDVTFASLVSLASYGIGERVVPVRLELARRQRDKLLLEQHFGCAVHFDAPADLMVLAAAELARPFLTHNADLLSVLVPALEAALGDALHTRSIADDVRMVLRRRMSGERPSVEKVAEELHMSLRTLQRRLGELGTSYQALLDDVRHDTSRQLLANTDLDAGEVAFLLGFEELNSFSRAFHGWEGVTPSRWRESAARGH